MSRRIARRRRERPRRHNPAGRGMGEQRRSMATGLGRGEHPIVRRP